MLIPERDRPAARIEAEALRHLARLDRATALRLEGLPTRPPEPASGALDAESLLLADARRLTRESGLLPALERAGAELRWLLFAGALGAGLTGAGLVAAAGLVTGSGVLNVYAVLVMLVGLNGLGLLAWLPSLAFSARLLSAPSRPFGSAVGPASEAWLRRLGLAGEGLAARIALLDATLGRHLQPWAGSALVHAFWALALLAASAVLALRLAVEQVDFIWETTLLSRAHFEWLTATLGRGPASLGFPLPDQDQIALTAGGVGIPVEHAAAVAARRAWAGWLIGCTLVWGLLPRTLALLGCLLVWRLRSRRHRLPLGLPFWLHRMQRLAPVGHVLGPLPAPGAARPDTNPKDEPTATAAQAADPSRPKRAAEGTRAGETAAALPPERGFGPAPGRVIGLELDDIEAWPAALPPGWSFLGAAGTGNPGSASAGPPGTRLVVLASLVHAPDRGLRRRLAEIAQAWPAAAELALVEEARALRRLGSAEALAVRAGDWVLAAHEAGLSHCWRLSSAAPPGGRPR